MTEKEFDELIKKAGIIAIEEIEAEEREKEETEKEHKFSKRFEENMKKFFEDCRKNK